jgi:hypothetical protein
MTVSAYNYMHVILAYLCVYVRFAPIREIYLLKKKETTYVYFIQLFTKLVPFVLHMNIFSLQRNIEDAAGYTISVSFFKTIRLCLLFF